MFIVQWMNGWIIWMDGWNNELINKLVNKEWINWNFWMAKKWINWWISQWMDELINELINGCKK